MAVFDQFVENYKDLVLLAYEPERDWPVVIRGKHKKSGGSIYPRNGQAHKELESIDRQLRVLNRQILGFFGVDRRCLPDGNGKGRPRKVKR